MSCAYWALFTGKSLKKMGAGGSATQWKRRSFGTEKAVEQVEPRLTMIGFQRKGALFFLSF